MRFRGKTSFGSTALGVMHDQVVKTEIRIEEFFLFWLHHSMQDLSFQTRDQTHAPCSGSMKY